MKVVIIENQKTQFSIIKSHFTNDVIILPTIADYDKFMNSVKIVLNSNYPFSTIIKNKVIIINSLIEYNPDIIIIDYKLSGSSKGLSGIELGKIIRKEYANIKIIFLSRLQSNEMSVQNELRDFNFPNWKWIEKGYAGQAINNKDYFKEYVFQVINNYNNYIATPPEIKNVIENAILDIGANFTSPNFIDNFHKWNTEIRIKIHKIGDSKFLVSKDNISVSYIRLSLIEDENIVDLINEVKNYCVHRHQNNFIIIKCKTKICDRLIANDIYNFENQNNSYYLSIIGNDNEIDGSATNIYLIKQN